MIHLLSPLWLILINRTWSKLGAVTFMMTWKRNSGSCCNFVPAYQKWTPLLYCDPPCRETHFVRNWRDALAKKKTEVVYPSTCPWRSLLNSRWLLILKERSSLVRIEINNAPVNNWLQYVRDIKHNPEDLQKLISWLTNSVRWKMFAPLNH